MAGLEATVRVGPQTITPKTEAVARTKTTVNPATNNTAAPVTRQRPVVTVVVSPSATAGVSAPDIPARYDRYPGTRGMQQGEAKEINPARAAARSATNSGPVDTAFWKVVPKSCASTVIPRPPVRVMGILQLNRELLQRIGGVITVVMGMTFIGLVPALQRDTRPTPRRLSSLAGAPLLGAVFGLGWTPCLGPTLAGVIGTRSA